MPNTPELGQRRKINWLNVNTVLCAAILIGAEVFGAAYAGGWAIAMLLGLGDYGIIGLRVLFFALGNRGDDLVRAAGAARRAVHLARVSGVAAGLRQGRDAAEKILRTRDFS